MPIISQLDRKSPAMRPLVTAIYAALVLGALTMLYPFLLMVAGSTKSGLDLPDNTIVPKFLINDDALYRKHIEGLFNESFEQMQMAYDTSAVTFATLDPPAAVNRRLVAQWQAFLKETRPPFYTYGLGCIQAPVSRGVMPYELRRFKQYLISRYSEDIETVNKILDTEYVNWNAFWMIPEDYTLRRNKPGYEPLDLAFRKFKQGEPTDFRLYFCVDGFYKTSFLKNQYTKKLAAYNEAHGTHYRSWDEIHLTRRVPQGTPKEREDWETFVRTILNLIWIRADDTARRPYQRFLQAKYRSLTLLNRKYGTHYASYSDIPLFDDPVHESLPASDWDSFLQGWKDPDTGKLYRVPLESLKLDTLDFRFRDYLRRRFGTVAKLNAALGTRYRNWLAVLPPQEQAHYLAFQAKKKWLRHEFVVRNYITVVDFIVLHGRGILNTVIYCLLAILSALIVNPLAAYALSRYRPPSAYKVLLFLMLTMAFPPMVTQIPVFLMLRQFNLLNTFWALVLPGLANGYMIFLLKGFFDSLPQELYESAALDGAGELIIFWKITMRLSHPILAVIALQAFTGAYANFMMALLICQDERMWTLMPWLYQLQQRSGQGVVFASLLIAAIPTFLVFAFCQNLIMRGIVVPVEK